MEKGGLVLRKWALKDPIILECIPSNSIDDWFNFSVFLTEDKNSFTKRDISDLAKVFDLLGWLVPFIIYVKNLAQNMRKKFSFLFVTEWSHDLKK